MIKKITKAIAIFLLNIISMLNIGAYNTNDILTVMNNAKLFGVQQTYMCKLAQIESNFNPKAKSPTSSARGLFQIINSTEKQLVKELGLDIGNIYDSNYNSYLASYLTSKSVKFLKRNNLPVTYTSLYALHFFGVSGGYKFLTTNNSELVKTYFPSAYKYNRGLIGNKTIGELKNTFKTKFSKKHSCKELLEE